MDRFLDVLKEYRGKKLLILCHDDADSDALGAAFVLARVLDGDMAVPRTVSEHARELQYKLKMKIVFQPEVNNYDLVIVVDTADAQQLPGCMPKLYLLIDHHPENKLLAGAAAAVYEQADSACQLVWRVCQALGSSLDTDLALALGAGIMGDTRYLATAANSTIAELAEILEAGGVTYRDLIRVARVTSQIERQVRLQAAFSGKLHQIGNCLVATTTAERNYVYYVTMMLLELGADISMVGYQQQENCFIRLAKNPTTAHCLDLSTVLKEAVKDYPKQNLWGSSEFAGFNGEADVETVTVAVLAGLEKLQKSLGLCQCTDTTPVP